MIRPAAPLPYRREELRWPQAQYGLSDVFGDEAPAILGEMVAMAGANGEAAHDSE